MTGAVWRALVFGANVVAKLEHGMLKLTLPEREGGIRKPSGFVADARA